MLTQRHCRLAALLGGCLMALTTTAAAAQQKAKLRLNLKEGQGYSVAMTTEQEIIHVVEGNRQETKETTRYALTLKPVKVEPDGTIHGTYTYDAVRVNLDGALGKVDYDSGRDKAAPAGPVAKGFAALVGQKVDVVISPVGEVKRVTGSEKLVEAMLAAMGPVNAQSREMTERQLTLQFGEEALKDSFGQMSMFFPRNPVALGESWQIERKVYGVAATLTSRYTLKSVAGGKATLDVKGTLKVDPQAAAREAPHAKLQLKGDQSGTVVLDHATGWVSSGTNRQTVEAKMVMDQGGRKLQVPMTFRWQRTFEQSKK
jgi:Family of unknown function (DUF6263)